MQKQKCIAILLVLAAFLTLFGFMAADKMNEMERQKPGTVEKPLHITSAEQSALALFLLTNILI